MLENKLIPDASWGPHLSPLICTLELTHSDVLWGPAEQTLGTQMHLNEGPECLTHTGITRLIEEELYMMACY